MDDRSSTTIHSRASFFGYELTIYGPEKYERPRLFWKYRVVRDGLTIQSCVNPGHMEPTEADAKNGAEHTAREDAFSINLKIPTESTPTWEDE